uniref:Uncharacterized protein n=1 Tax=viral metagenome TaxID=1070528 RepID=A0A6M3KF03_9ZZZZ
MNKDSAITFDKTMVWVIDKDVLPTISGDVLNILIGTLVHRFNLGKKAMITLDKGELISVGRYWRSRFYPTRNIYL